MKPGVIQSTRTCRQFPSQGLIMCRRQVTPQSKRNGDLEGSSQEKQESSIFNKPQRLNAQIGEISRMMHHLSEAMLSSGVTGTREETSAVIVPNMMLHRAQGLHGLCVTVVRIRLHQQMIEVLREARKTHGASTGELVLLREAGPEKDQPGGSASVRSIYIAGECTYYVLQADYFSSRKARFPPVVFVVVCGTIKKACYCTLWIYCWGVRRRRLKIAFLYSYFAEYLHAHALPSFKRFMIFFVFVDQSLCVKYGIF